MREFWAGFRQFWVDAKRSVARGRYEAGMTLGALVFIVAAVVGPLLLICRFV